MATRQSFPLKERLAGASLSEAMKVFTLEELVRDLSPSELIRVLMPEVLEALRKILDTTVQGPGDAARQD